MELLIKFVTKRNSFQIQKVFMINLIEVDVFVSMTLVNESEFWRENVK